MKIELIIYIGEKEGGRSTDGDSKVKNNDMLGALLASGEHFTDEEIVGFMLALLVAGYETTLYHNDSCRQVPHRNSFAFSTPQGS